MIPVTQVCRALVRYATYCMPVCSVLHAADTAVVKVHDQVSGSAATLQAETLKIEGAIEVFAGISTGSPDSTTVVRHGFIGQLTDPASLQLSAPASEVAEEGTLTLSAKTLNTDSTHNVVSVAT